MHTRPLIDIHSQTETQIVDHLANKFFEKVMRAGGTITGEHGDGMARVKYIESVYGPEIT